MQEQNFVINLFNKHIQEIYLSVGLENAFVYPKNGSFLTGFVSVFPEAG